MTEAAQRLAEAEAAKDAYRRFVGPALDTIQADYMKRLIDHAARPMTGDNLKVVEKLSIGMKVADEVRSQINALILDGEVARQDIDRAGKLARLSPEGKRYAQY